MSGANDVIRKHSVVCFACLDSSQEGWEKAMSSKTGSAGSAAKHGGGRNKGETFLTRQAKAAKKTVTEEELNGKDITPEDVMLLDQATKGKSFYISAPLTVLFLLLLLEYLCNPAANIYNIEFTRFKIRDMESQDVLFEINKATDENESPDQGLEKPEPSRFVRYQFPVGFLSLQRVGAT